jgi:hypothetical protein
MGRSQRRKGANGERELCALLSDELGRVVQRRLGQAREGGADVLDLPPFVLEVKRRGRIGSTSGSPHRWMDQAIKATPRGHVPVVAFRADGEQWLVAFRLADAVQLMREQLLPAVPWKDDEP